MNLPRFLLVLVPLLVAPACSSTSSGTHGGLTTPDPGGADVAGYRALTTTLEAKRHDFKDKRAMYPQAFGNRIQWLEFPTIDATLHAFDDTTKTQTDYTFSIGKGDDFNYRASASLVVTAQRDGDKVTFSAYRADAANGSVGTLTVPAPTDEQKWWAYAASGGDVYFVTTGSATLLQKWTPAKGPTASTVVDLAAAGVDVGIFMDLGVEGNRCFFVESGRLWQLDLTTKKAQWLHNDKEISGTISWDDAGVLYDTAGGPLYLRFSSGEVLDVAAKIQASDYRVARGYDGAHLYEDDAVLSAGKVYYKGGAGIFTFDVASSTIAPVLLEPLPPEDGSSNLRIVYRYPQVLTDGAIFVTGLTSTDGAVGADGPLYRVDP